MPLVSFRASLHEPMTKSTRGESFRHALDGVTLPGTHVNEPRVLKPLGAFTNGVSHISYALIPEWESAHGC